MIELRLAPADLARVRFARSALEELVHSVNVLAGRKGQQMHRRWITMAGQRLSGIDLGLIDQLVKGRNLLPDFVLPVPERWDTRIEDELEKVRTLPEDVVRASMDEVWGGGRLPSGLRALHDHPRRELGRLVGMLRAYWDAAIDPVWPRICAVHDADMNHRLGDLSSGGVAHVFDNLHPKVEYTGDRLHVHLEAHTGTQTLTGEGIVLVPSVFVWPRLVLAYGERRQTVLSYAPRGIAEVWTRAAPASNGSLGELLGHTRATILTLLDLPISTTQLAADLKMSAASVSEHLSILRRNRLVTSRRSGRTVLYERTQLATDLCGGATK